MAMLRAPKSLTNANPWANWNWQGAITDPGTSGKVLDASTVDEVPAAMLAVVNAAGAFAPNAFNVQVPACDVVPNGSDEVFEIAMPVSNPDWLVTNGNNRMVRQTKIVTALTP